MICWKIACILSALLSVLIALNTQEVLMDKRRKWFQAICRSLRNGPMCSQIHQKNKRIKMYPWVYIATRHQNHRILICSSDFLNCIFLRKQEQLVVCMDKIKMLLGKVVCVGAAGLGNTLCFHTILLNLTVVVLCSVVSDSLWPHGLKSTRLLCPWNFLGKNTGVDCHFLFHGIFPTQ